MKRYEKARDYVMKAYGNIYHPTLKQLAMSHTASVDSFAALLAAKRGQPMELIKIAALFHDWATFMENCLPKLHAQKSAKAACTWLEQEDYTPEEIDKIVTAIALHSKKKQMDSPFDEVLKDADVLASWAQDPEEEMSQKAFLRLEKLKEELGIN